MQCEVCGASDADKIAEVEGSEMRVCEECSSLGTVKSKSSSKKRKPKKKTKGSDKSWRDSSETEEVLKRDYGKVVRDAREGADLTMEDLAEKISEKESVVRRVENEELRPDEKLSKKLERELDIELFEEMELDVKDFSSGEDEELTIGDVAEVK